MGSNVNKATSKGHKKTTISKAEAGQKKEDLIKSKGESSTKKFSEWFTKHRKKIFIIICAAAIIAVVAFIVVIFIHNQSKGKSVEAWQEEISANEAEIDKYLEDAKESSETPYTETINHFEELCDQETDPDKKFALFIAQIRYLTNIGDYQEGKKLLALVMTPDMTDEQNYLYALAAYNLYIEAGDLDMANYYFSIMESLPNEVKPNGGGGA